MQTHDNNALNYPTRTSLYEPDLQLFDRSTHNARENTIKDRPKV